MKKPLIILLITFSFFLGICVLLFQTSKSRTFQFFGEIYPRVETTKKIVALTFDDGPSHSQTNEILSVLRDENVKATFYLIGNEIEKNQGEAEKMIAEGHEIGNHTYNHERMILVSPSFVKNEIDKTDELIKKAGYKGEITFRPPYCRKLFALPWHLS